MTITLERSVGTQVEDGPSLLDETRWKQWRSYIDDRTHLVDLEREFPYFAQELGAVGLNTFILTAADNKAGTFKNRGAFEAASWAHAKGYRALTAASQGNHGTGVALAGQYLDLPTTIFLPYGAAPTKIEKMRSFGATVIVDDETLEDAQQTAQSVEGAYYIAPFENPHVRRGQGTLVDDILAEDPFVQTILATAGGFGMISGMAQRLHELGRQDIRLVAAVAEGATSLEHSIKTHRVQKSREVPYKYGGAAVQAVGPQCLRQGLRHKNNLEVVTVPDAHVFEVAEQYVLQNRDLLRRDIPMYEPTTLLAVAALRQARPLWGRTAVIGSGVNEPVEPWLERYPA